MLAVYLSAFANLMLIGVALFFVVFFILMFVTDADFPIWSIIFLGVLVLSLIFTGIFFAYFQPFYFSNYNRCPTCNSIVHNCDEFCTACGYCYNRHCDCGYNWLEGDVYCPKCGKEK